MTRTISDSHAAPRPVLGLLDATTTLCDFAMVTYDVDAERLGALLPKGCGMDPEVVTLPGGDSRALVSAVNFRDVDFRFGVAPCVRATFVQTNYRAYIRRGSERAVWFFGTALASRLSAFPRLAWGMPWHDVRASLEATWDGERCLAYASSSEGRWGSAHMRLAGNEPAAAPIAGFSDRAEALHVLTHPLIGYFAHRRGGIGRYTVWHERLRPGAGRALEARFDVFEALGLVEPDQPPHSVLLQRETEFVVELPPSRPPVRQSAAAVQPATGCRCRS